MLNFSLILVLALFLTPTPGFSKNLTDIEKTLQSLQTKFQLPTKTVEKWKTLLHSVEAHLDFDLMDDSISLCEKESPDLVTPCVDSFTQLTHDLLKNLKIGEGVRAAISLGSTNYSAAAKMLGKSEIISAQQSRSCARYLRAAQDKGFLETLQENLTQAMAGALTFCMGAPSTELKTRKEFAKAVFLSPLNWGVDLSQMAGIPQPEIGRLLQFVQKDENRFYRFLAKIENFWTKRFSPNPEPTCFRDLINNLMMFLQSGAGSETGLAILKNTIEFSEAFARKGYSYPIEISQVLRTFEDLGYEKKDWPELVDHLDKDTYEAMAPHLNLYGYSQFERFKSFLERLDYKGQTRMIPISKMVYFLAGWERHSLETLNEFLARLNATRSQALINLLKEMPLLVLSHFTENALKLSPNPIEKTPVEWAETVRKWVSQYPESKNPKVKAVYFEILQGRWDPLASALAAAYPDSDAKKIKTFIGQALNSVFGTHIRKNLMVIELTGNQEIKSELAYQIHHYASPFLMAYLTQIEYLLNPALLPRTREILKFAEKKGILHKPTSINRVRSLVLEYEINKMFDWVNHSHLTTIEQENLRRIIKIRILPKPPLVRAYEDLFQSGLSLDPKWIEWADNYSEIYIPAMLKNRDKDPDRLIQSIEANAKPRNISLTMMGAAIGSVELASALAEDSKLISEFEDHLYAKASPFPENKPLYRWGEKEYEKRRIGGDAFNLGVGNFGGQAYGPGIYLSDDSLCSSNYGVGCQDPYLIAVILPPDTRLLDLSTEENRSDLWAKLKDEPLIQRAGVEPNALENFLSFFNPKSIVFRNSSLYYVYKTSKNGLKETVLKPQLTLTDAKEARLDTYFAKPGKESAVFARFFKTLLEKESEWTYGAPPSTLLKFNFGRLYRVLEESPKTPFSIEVRDSVVARKSFRCLTHSGRTFIATPKKGFFPSDTDLVHESHYETYAKTCEELEGNWKNGFICDRYPFGIKFVDLQAPEDLPLQGAFFPNQETCTEAGNHRNLFWRCIPEGPKKVSIQPEYLFLSSNLLVRSAGQFKSLQSCFESLDKMSLGTVCIPKGDAFKKVHLIQNPHSIPQDFSSFQKCDSEIESQARVALQGLIPEAETLPSEGLLKRFIQIPSVQTLMEQPNTEGGSLEFHSTAVLDSWDHQVNHPNGALREALAKIADESSIPQKRLTSLLRSVVALHDLGKPLSHEHQHLSTVELVQPILDRMGFSKAETTLGLAIIDHDMIGEFLIHEPTKGTQRALKLYVRSLARILGVHPNPLFKVMVSFYTADASFYPYVRSKVFREREDGSLEIIEPLLQELIGKL